MTDIAERLRKNSGWPTFSMLNEAADTIERLAGLVREARLILMQCGVSDWDRAKNWLARTAPKEQTNG